MNSVKNYLYLNSNSIVLGELNIHFSNEQNDDSQRLNKIISLLGYERNVNLYTHKAGHTDAEFYSSLIIECIPGNFLSDHRAVICNLECPKESHEKLLYTELTQIKFPAEESTTVA